MPWLGSVDLQLRPCHVPQSCLPHKVAYSKISHFSVDPIQWQVPLIVYSLSISANCLLFPVPSTTTLRVRNFCSDNSFTRIWCLCHLFSGEQLECHFFKVSMVFYPSKPRIQLPSLGLQCTKWSMLTWAIACSTSPLLIYGFLIFCLHLVSTCLKSFALMLHLPGVFCFLGTCSPCYQLALNLNAKLKQEGKPCLTPESKVARSHSSNHYSILLFCKWFITIW